MTDNTTYIYARSYIDFVSQNGADLRRDVVIATDGDFVEFPDGALGITGLQRYQRITDLPAGRAFVSWLMQSFQDHGNRRGRGALSFKSLVFETLKPLPLQQSAILWVGPDNLGLNDDTVFVCTGRNSDVPLRANFPDIQSPLDQMIVTVEFRRRVTADHRVTIRNRLTDWLVSFAPQFASFLIKPRLQPEIAFGKKYCQLTGDFTGVGSHTIDWLMIELLAWCNFLPVECIYFTESDPASLPLGRPQPTPFEDRLGPIADRLVLGLT